MSKIVSYPKPKGFELDDDSRVLIGSRVRGLSAQLGLKRPLAPAKRKRKAAARKRGAR